MTNGVFKVEPRWARWPTWSRLLLIGITSISIGVSGAAHDWSAALLGLLLFCMIVSVFRTEDARDWLLALFKGDDSPKRLCTLGYGHTGHIWELTGPYPIETGVYFCVGQPFSDGFDPADERNHP